MSGGRIALSGFDYQTIVILDQLFDHFDEHPGNAWARPEGTDDLDLVFVFTEQPMQFLQSLRFVVDDNSAASHKRTSVNSGENSGNVNVTRVPVGWTADNRSMASSR